MTSQSSKANKVSLTKLTQTGLPTGCTDEIAPTMKCHWLRPYILANYSTLLRLAVKLRTGPHWQLPMSDAHRRQTRNKTSLRWTGGGRFAFWEDAFWGNVFVWEPWKFSFSLKPCLGVACNSSSSSGSSNNKHTTQ